ncbi:TnsA endonuclease N-terminal domain-containing protein [Paenibacillus sp. MMS18-CY102]|uniref:TnsA endonuclease N-terminal domain-containing protein n=1 Tax=Paenibacillus sp. MMS18-CY102 TaxID=2682849 RepID=UPI0013653F05|nr:hypothetical protein [Paenibacillus sp. MMS18-CY102]
MRKYTPQVEFKQTRYGSNHWIGFSPKLNRNVNLYSDLEYANWIFVETNPEIISFCEQPAKAFSIIDGKPKTSIIDMWILRKDGTEAFIEVKYARDLDFSNPKNEKVRKQILCQQQWCEENGFEHLVHTEEFLYESPYFIENMKIILAHIRDNKFPDELKYKRLQNALNNKKSTIRRVKDSLCNQQWVTSSIYHLIYAGLWNAELRIAPLTDLTEVECYEQKES